jgi:hypothetical protein
MKTRRTTANQSRVLAATIAALGTAIGAMPTELIAADQPASNAPSTAPNKVTEKMAPAASPDKVHMKVETAAAPDKVAQKVEVRAADKVVHKVEATAAPDKVIDKTAPPR